MTRPNSHNILLIVYDDPIPSMFSTGAKLRRFEFGLPSDPLFRKYLYLIANGERYINASR